jgi:hypothetical protein
MAYLIVKNVSGVIGEQILIYPPREGDEIFDFLTLTEAQEKLNEIQINPIYSDCILQIIEDIDWLL